VHAALVSAISRSGVPGQRSVHCSAVAQLALHAAPQVIVQVAPDAQVTDDPAPSDTSQLAPMHDTFDRAPTETTQSLAAGQLTTEPSPASQSQVPAVPHRSVHAPAQIFPQASPLTH
jgi:hypothetical protein